MPPFDVLVVLGCRVILSGRESAWSRRVRHATKLYRSGVAPKILICGGRRWDGVSEAEAMRDQLVREGVSADEILIETVSSNTRENARFGAEILRAEGLTKAAIVTCDWHAPRAVSLFVREGIDATATPCVGPQVALHQAIFRVIRERTSTWFDRRHAGRALTIAIAGLAIGGSGACGESTKKAPGPGLLLSSASSGASMGSARVIAIASAEVTRQGSAVKDSDLSDRDVRVRRAAARALARIGEPAIEKKSSAAASASVAAPPVPTPIASADANQATIVSGLKKLLSDEDPEVVAFAAYGLGWTCRGREDEHVRALVARAFGLAATAPIASTPRPATSAAAKPSASAAQPLPKRGVKHPLSQLDPEHAIARALGRCASVEAERTLLSWIAQAENAPKRAMYAALGLGDLATRRRPSDETLVTLTQAASASAVHPIDEALFPFTRIDPGSPALVTRVREVAVERLDGGRNLFAVRALGRTDATAVPELKRVLTGSNGDAIWAAKAEAARSLGKLGAPGQAALLEVLAELAPAADELVPTVKPGTGLTLLMDPFGPLMVILESLTAPISPSASPTLAALAKLGLPSDDVPRPLKTRLVLLRCAAAALIAGEKIDDPHLVACDPEPDGARGQLARLAVLGRRNLTNKASRELIQGLAVSSHPAVRAAALEQIGTHRELPDRAALLAAALKSEHAGTVSAAAEQLAGADPMGTDKKGGVIVREALTQAIARTWAPDDLETVASLIDAVGGLYLVAGKEFVQGRCDGTSVALREHARRALRRLGVDEPTCPTRPMDPAAELDHVTTKSKVIFDTDAGQLTIDLDPNLAPVAATRFVDLASAGFFDNMAVHRVVPGFVVQFGDPDGDGFGGASKPPLACETSPAPFDALSVGVALAGRDTGSSQFFVTLSRTPHLDGDYAWIGRATGDWAAIVPGDKIVKARVE